MLKKVFLFLVFMAALLPSAAQESGRLSYGLDARRDSIAIAAIRARMDSIRAERPTVALVLAGGGAKGAAHVGAIKYLEKNKIPVDLVLGTSVGGLIGGFYSLGYSASQIDTIISRIDWSVALSDKIPRQFLTYSEHLYKQKYLISIPFYYPRKGPYADSRMGQHRHRDLQLGNDSGTDGGDLLRNNLISSLPSGLVSGLNVGNILSSITVGYQDECEFWKLPIPFVCVATELVSGKAKVWYSGKLSTALRSTMSIPGLFTPVRTDGMVLVDGGMRNNYPTDLARELGADLVIGVDLHTKYKDDSTLNNIADIIEQGVDMLGRQAYEKNSVIPDVRIRPDLEGYDMMSFSRRNMEVLAIRGWDAAVAQDSAIQVVRNLVGDALHRLPVRRAIDLQKDTVQVCSVEINGVSDRASRYLMPRLGIKAGDRVTGKDVEDAVATIYGTKAFDYVSYELLGTDEPFRLKINCKKGPVHQLGLGFRLDTDEIVSVLVNLGFNVHNLQGHAGQVTGKVGTNPGIWGRYMYMTERGPAFNAAASLRYVDRNQFSIDEDRLNASYLNFRQELFLSNMKFRNMDLNLGVRNDFYRLNTIMGTGLYSDYDLSVMHNSYVSAFLSARADNFDRPWFPSSGVQTFFDGNWVMGALGAETPSFLALSGGFKSALSLGHVTMLPFADGRFIFGAGERVPMPFLNAIGGRLRGRYLDQQIPFMGVTNAVSMPRYMAVAGAELRMHFFRNSYVSAIANIGNATDRPENFKLFKDTFSGVGLEYAYDSILGPFRADVHWSSLTGTVGVYMSLGFDF